MVPPLPPTKEMLKLEHEYAALLASLATKHKLAKSQLQHSSNLQAPSSSTGLIPNLIPDSAEPLLAPTEHIVPQGALGSGVRPITLLPVVSSNNSANHLPAPRLGTLTSVPSSSGRRVTSSTTRRPIPASGPGTLTTVPLSPESTTGRRTLTNVLNMVLKPFQKYADDMSPLHSTPAPRSSPGLLSFNSADLCSPNDSPLYDDEPVVAPSTALQPSSTVRPLESSSYGGVPLVSSRGGAPTISQLRLNTSQNFIAVDVDAANHAAAEAVADAHDYNDAEAAAHAYAVAEYQAQTDAEDTVDALERKEIEVWVRIRAQQEASDKAKADTRARAAATAQAREFRIQGQVEAFFQAQAKQDQAANSAAETADVIDADATAAAKVQAIGAAPQARIQDSWAQFNLTPAVPAQVPDVSAGNNRQIRIKAKLQQLRDKALDNQTLEDEALRLFTAEAAAAIDADTAAVAAKVQVPASVPHVSIEVRLQQLRDKALEDQALENEALQLFTAEQVPLRNPGSDSTESVDDDGLSNCDQSADSVL